MLRELTLSEWYRRWGLSPSRRQIELLLDDADPAMVLPVWRSGKCNVCYEFHAALLESFGQLSECLCLDSHCCYLVRFTAFIIPDRAGNSQIQFFCCITMFTAVMPFARLTSQIPFTEWHLVKSRPRYWRQAGGIASAMS